MCYNDLSRRYLATNACSSARCDGELMVQGKVYEMVVSPVLFFNLSYYFTR
jgi:hypothetical protein